MREEGKRHLPWVLQATVIHGRRGCKGDGVLHAAQAATSERLSRRRHCATRVRENVRRTEQKGECGVWPGSGKHGNQVISENGAALRLRQSSSTWKICMFYRQVACQTPNK